ncbi:SMC family ATPase [Nocardioides sp. InS609-2]|uniref:AAA family ATPase n=1 Tax=Nocardioides sp. InS609-2 TaxID=2760705 RepID=UPI0020BF3508|nr:SMC family ATPase [Nocardioides sp. InS609-2]
MRLHTLEVTAFGPFADEVTVDFDALSEAGLFLLSGATGAGKTSVLDAVCFALYGDVPGDRGAAKRLRSDHAEPGLAPRVCLEATLAGRRFRIARAPAWERPKRRGTGTTVQQASVTLIERVDGEWVPLTSRMDEAGHLVTGLLGMTLTQFCQVAMLPQGRFQAFLRARSEERHALLQRLFRTGRFEQMERWLRDHRLALRHQSREQHDRIAHLLQRFGEAADVAFPAEWDLHDLQGVAPAISPWLDTVAGDADASQLEATARAERAAATEAAIAEALAAGRALARSQARRLAAVRDLEALEAEAETQAERRERLEAASRAATLAPLFDLSDRATEEAAVAARDAAAVSGHLATCLDCEPSTIDIAEAERHRRQALETGARGRALLPRRDRCHAVRREVEALDDRRETLVARLDAARCDLAGLPGRISDLRAAHATAQVACETLPATELELTTIERRRSARAEVQRLTSVLAEVGAAHRQAVDTLHSHTASWLDLREQRLTGMAAEIAGQLAVGACCPVCGSAEHPHKAAAGPGATDAVAERAAHKEVETAKAVEHAHANRVREVSSQLAVYREVAGSTDDDLAAAAAAVAARVAALRADAAALDARAAAVAAAEAEREHADASLRKLDADLLALDHTRSGFLQEEADALAAIDAELAGTGHDDLDELLRQSDRVALLAAAAADAQRADTRARETLDGHRSMLRDALAAHGLADPGEARACLLDDEELADLTGHIERHVEALATARGVVGDAESLAAAEQPAPDVDRLAEAWHLASADAGRAKSRHDRDRRRVERLASLGADLATALTGWSPMRDQLEVATTLSSFVDGKSADNRLQMRLSAYVLSYRLSQVVAAANDRLRRMSDQRYSLEHTGQRGAGETRGGLSLLVRDDWSGDTRDPATLSGGETFVVSLALALGLADVIAHEAGGADLDTLFVDEGFGSLDADTLDDVMDTLDALRDGGRVVGVVSHVAEMRDRIPTQLRVIKARSGSRVEAGRG